MCYNNIQLNKNKWNQIMNYKALIEYMRERAVNVDEAIIEDWVYSAVDAIAEGIDKFEDYATANAREEKITKMVMWHIRRMNGFGGSDMSVLYQEYKGGFTYYGGDETIDAASIVAGKLALVNVTGTTGDMQRGNYLEEVARQSFERKMKQAGYNLVRYAAGIDKLEEFMKEGWDEHPWCFSSPDGLYRDTVTGEVWLVDFKVPNDPEKAIEYSFEPPLHYKAQLAQYKANLEAAGVNVDKVALVPFSTKEWSVYIGGFEISQDFINDILACGDHYWEFVEKGELPMRPPGKDFQSVEELPINMQVTMNEYISIASLQTQADNKKKQLKESLLEMAANAGIDWKQDGMTSRLPGVSISYKEGASKINSTALKAKVKELGGDIDDPTLYTKGAGSSTIRLIGSKKSPFFDHVNDFKALATVGMSDVINDVREHSDFIKDSATDVYDPTAPDEAEKHRLKSQPKDAEFDGLGF